MPALGCLVLSPIHHRLQTDILVVTNTAKMRFTPKMTFVQNSTEPISGHTVSSTEGAAYVPCQVGVRKRERQTTPLKNTG